MNDIITDSLFDFHDKDMLVRQLERYMFARTQSIFEYDGLPETIPARNLELLLQFNGFACVGKANDGNLYAFYGGLGGEPNVYYEPTICTVANPALKFNKEFVIGEDCVIIKSDSLYTGLRPLFNRYASLQAENAISLRIADINSRIKTIISASDDRAKDSAELYLKRMEEGKLGIISEPAIVEALTVNTASDQHGIITDLIEYEQYIKAAWYNEIGLNANYNMKRESLNSAESQLNDDALLPLIDDMLRNRREGLKQINEMFGLNITVDLNSAWKKQQEEQLDDAPDIDDETHDDPEEAREEWEEQDDVRDEDAVNDEDTEDETKEDIKEIKEDIEDIKEELDGKEDDYEDDKED